MIFFKKLRLFKSILNKKIGLPKLHACFTDDARGVFRKKRPHNVVHRHARDQTLLNDTIFY